MDRLYRNIIEATQGAVTPSEIDQMTPQQSGLYFAKPKISEAAAVAIAKRQAERLKAKG